MTFGVDWNTDAEDALADAWLRADDPDAVRVAILHVI